MKIAVIGAGTIGTTVGGRWSRAGHEVVYGVRDSGSERYRDLAGRENVSDIAGALLGADAVLISTPGGSVPDLLQSYGPDLDGHLILDATNDTAGASFHHIPLFESSLPSARVYRAFNTLGWENFEQPSFDGENADLFYSGPEGESREMVERLISDVDLRPMYVGEGSAGADLLDGITRLWFQLALRRGHGRHLAFRTLGVPES
jgi:predicted dinucleotide-binding enzyme